MIPEPDHVFLAEQALVGRVEITRCVQIRLGDRVDQNLLCQSRLSAQRCALGDHRGKVAAGTVAGHDQRCIGCACK
ncbi:hypothetical protein D3C84_999570 [compost metagenome]